MVKVLIVLVIIASVNQKSSTVIISCDHLFSRSNATLSRFGCVYVRIDLAVDLSN